MLKKLREVGDDHIFPKSHLLYRWRSELIAINASLENMRIPEKLSHDLRSHPVEETEN